MEYKGACAPDIGSKAMQCKKYSQQQGGTCPRKARWLVEKQPLCNYHAYKRPLEIVQSDIEKWSKWVKVKPVAENGLCQSRGGAGGCLHKYGSQFAFDEAGPAAFTVNGGVPLCLYHAEQSVFGEAQFGQYLPKLIRIEDYQSEGVDDE